MYIDIRFRGGLEKQDIRAFCELLCNFGVDLPFRLRHVTFVCAQRYDRDGVAIPLQLGDLPFRPLECVSIIHIVHDDSKLAAPVVHRRDGGKALLPCGIPDLKLELLPVISVDYLVHVRRPHSNGYTVLKCVVCKAQGYARLSHAGCAQQH